MFGKIALLLALLYFLLNFLILRWPNQKPKHKFYDDEEYVRATLEKLLVTRHVGSPGHKGVRDFLDKEIMRLGFLSKQDDFFQGLNFSNVAGFWNDQANLYLVLTCHYDGPSPRKGQKKTTDGAVSCAILLALVKTFKFFARALGPETGLVVVFFDGHEPLATDPVNKPMLYGSQHFANTEFIPVENIALVVTLNHIGGPDPIFTSYSQHSDRNHFRIAKLEEELRKSGELVGSHVLFQKKRSSRNDLPDDHMSFTKSDVSVLHIAPENYPNDEGENLHWPTILNMIKILRKFIIDYLVWIDFDRYVDVDYYDPPDDFTVEEDKK